MYTEKVNRVIRERMPAGVIEGIRWKFLGQWIVFNPAEDLNACAAFEQTLDPVKNLLNEEDGEETQWGNYVWNLEHTGEPTCAEEDIYNRTISATPMQRCKAYIKTVCPEEWEETPHKNK
jgi:hypothetical protein